jgi:hypothetical protein
MKKIFRVAAFTLALGSMTAGFTGCEDDEVETGSIDVSNLTIKADKDGKIAFIGDVSSNDKIKVFQLQNSNGTVVYDFVANNDVVKEKLKQIDDNGEVTKEKVFSVKGVESNKVAVDFYTLVIKTKNTNNSVSIALGEELNYTIGATKSSSGSYLSITNNKQMTVDVASKEASEVIAKSSSDGYSVEGLQAASKAGSAAVASIADKVALYQNGSPVSVVTAGGVIFTQSGCICKINSFANTSTGDATINAVTIRAVNDLKVDLSEIPSGNYTK